MKKEKIREEYSRLNNKVIAPLPTDAFEIERQYKLSKKIGFLEGMLSFMDKQYSFIDKTVFRFKKNNFLTSIEEYNIRCKADSAFEFLNPINEKFFIATHRDYIDVENDYIIFRIEKLIDSLCSPNTEYTGLFGEWTNKNDREILEFLKEL